MSEFIPVSQGGKAGAQDPASLAQSQAIPSQTPHDKQSEINVASQALSTQSTQSQALPTQSIPTQSTQPDVITYESNHWSNPTNSQNTIEKDDDDDDDDDDDITKDRDSLRALMENDDAEILRRFGEECAQSPTQAAVAATAAAEAVTKLPLPAPVAPLAQEDAEPSVPPAAAAAATATATPVMPSLKVTPILQNIVATVNLGCPLDLKKITAAARNTEYNPQRFPALIMRIRDPKATALIFASGKVVCTGTKSEEMAKYAAKKFARIIQKIGFQVTFKNFKIQNIVASCDVKFPIRLEQLSQEVDRFSTYEPEIFPGLIFRMAEPKVSLLIFVSGKIVLSGAKTIADIRDAFNSIIPVLKKYQKTL